MMTDISSWERELSEAVPDTLRIRGDARSRWIEEDADGHIICAVVEDDFEATLHAVMDFYEEYGLLG